MGILRATSGNPEGTTGTQKDEGEHQSYRDREGVKVLRLRLGQRAKKRDGIGVNEESGRRGQKLRARASCLGGKREEGSLNQVKKYF